MAYVKLSERGWHWYFHLFSVLLDGWYLVRYKLCLPSTRVLLMIQPVAGNPEYTMIENDPFPRYAVVNHSLQGMRVTQLYLLVIQM